MIYVIAVLLGLPFVTWVAYLAVMALKANQHELTPTAKFFAYFFLFVIGYPLDVLMNVICGTVFFLELPRETLFTARCNRHITQGSGWRKAQAQWWCCNFLDPFDFNDRHCT